MAGADLDGDGDTDVVSAEHYPGTMVWLESDGGLLPEWQKHEVPVSASTSLEKRWRRRRESNPIQADQLTG